MLNIATIVIPTFFIILIGYIFGKKTKADISSLIDIGFYIGVPALVFVSMLDKQIVLLDAGKVWAAAILITFGCGIVAWIVFTILRQKHSGLYLPITMMNTVNIPFPIIFLAYGSEGLLAATLFFIPGVLLMFTVGSFIAAGKQWKESIKEVFKQPTIYAAIAGLLLNLFGVTVPELIVRSLNLVGMLAIPLVLILLGYSLTKISITSLRTTLLASFLRVGVGLLFGLLAVNIFNLTGVLRAVVILDSAMPAAVLVSMLTTKYRNEAELVSGVVFITTIASLAIIPFLLYMLSGP
ncbi:MAG: hypothetical protein CL873_00010 [Dehalococcoidales bacterium]|jgi:hypothetical protein|nr:hypothetical protein [Dehalococcoidales bacterium]|tara:strand:+ start:77 stop:961 length:885 start_codon:yes stop_codon:yes gene_type:complete